MIQEVIEQKSASWIQHLLPIIKEQREGSDMPLDGDEVDTLCHIIRAIINLHEGNITDADLREEVYYDDKEKWEPPDPETKVFRAMEGGTDGG